MFLGLFNLRFLEVENNEMFEVTLTEDPELNTERQQLVNQYYTFFITVYLF